MHIERLVLEIGGPAFTLELHPMVTVCNGLGRVEREGLVTELVGALGRGRAGAHLELVTDEGSRLALFRPSANVTHLIDVDRQLDVSDTFRIADGSIDLLRRAGHDATSGRSLLCVTKADLVVRDEQDALIEALAAIDQKRLWAAADHLIQVTDEIAANTEGEEVTADVEVVDRIESDHAALMGAQRSDEQSRRQSRFLAVVSAAAVVPLAWLEGTAIAMVFVLFAAVAALASMSFWRRARRADDKSRSSLSEAGADSYLGYHLDRVDGVLASESRKRRLGVMAEAQARARATWAELTSETPHDWAIEHRGEIAAAAERGRERSEGASAAAPDQSAADYLAALTALLDDRLDALCRVGPAGQTLPMILDDPFADLDLAIKNSLLAFLAERAVDQQIIYLTDDPDVAAWARAKAGRGRVRTVEIEGGLEILAPAEAAADL